MQAKKMVFPKYKLEEISLQAFTYKNSLFSRYLGIEKLPTF